ncbi:MAG TPA: IS91 family transposase [Bacteroidales bacterium]|nr:IS91 family transposase [Bacteroidales bacterium]
MSRSCVELANIATRFGKQFVEQYNPNAYHQRVLQDITQCRTAELGGHSMACDDCGQITISYNSCRNRHCPKCLASKQALWVDDLLETTLDVKHYHIVFTVPHELNPISQLNSAWFYNQMFATVWDTLRSFGYSHFGVETGAICVLHTWGQNLSLHPHVHCIVPAAGESLSGRMKHIGNGGKFLYPVRQLSVTFRGKLMDAIKKQLKAIGLLPKFQQLLNTAWGKQWVVFCEPSMAKPGHVVKYLGQYTHRVAITNDRILSIDGQNVCFMHKDYADHARQKPITLNGVEFLRRFCLHILPRRFVKIRRYGIYSSRYRALQKKKNPKMLVKPKETARERLARITGYDMYRCPVCKSGTLHPFEALPRIRSPDTLYAVLNTSKN